VRFAVVALHGKEERARTLRAALSLLCRKVAAAAVETFKPDDHGRGNDRVRSSDTAAAELSEQGPPAGPAPGTPVEDFSHYFCDEDGHIHILA
jgi:hypothetical protein